MFTKCRSAVICLLVNIHRLCAITLKFIDNHLQSQRSKKPTESLARSNYVAHETRIITRIIGRYFHLCNSYNVNARIIIFGLNVNINMHRKISSKKYLLPSYLQ